MSELHHHDALSCETARSLLSTRPDAETDVSRLTLHLDECSACSVFREMQQSLDRQLSNAMVMEPPAWLTASILQQVNPEPAVSWWARPRINLALQWSFYVLVSGGLLLGLLLPFEGVVGWTQVVLAQPGQLGVAFDVLISVVGLIPLDPIVGVLDDASWVYEFAALALVFWWLRQGSSTSESRSPA